MTCMPSSTVLAVVCRAAVVSNHFPLSLPIDYATEALKLTHGLIDYIFLIANASINQQDTSSAVSDHRSFSSTISHCTCMETRSFYWNKMAAILGGRFSLIWPFDTLRAMITEHICAQHQFIYICFNHSFIIPRSSPD